MMEDRLQNVIKGPLLGIAVDAAYLISNKIIRYLHIIITYFNTSKWANNVKRYNATYSGVTTIDMRKIIPGE